MPTPTQIGRYKIIEEVGRGGMGTVYAALDPRFKRKVALKVLPQHFLHDPNFVTRFESEAQFVAALEHPAIVPVYDFGGLDSQPFLVMRLLNGGSLSKRIREHGAIAPATISAIMVRLCSALDKAHQHGIIHRDLKPDNILFDDEDRPYLTDFGIARLSEATRTMTIAGTPAYMSPEQWEGEKLDERSDIYAMGIVLYEMLTGRRPYHSDTPASLMREHLLSPVPDPLAVQPNLPSSWRAVIKKALAKQRDARFATAHDLAAAVMKAAADEPGTTAAIQPQDHEPEVDSAGFTTVIDSPAPAEETGADAETVVQMPAPKAAQTPLPVKNEGRSGRRKPLLWVVGAVGIMIALFAIVFIGGNLLSGSGDNEAAPTAAAAAADTSDATRVMPTPAAASVPTPAPTLPPVVGSTPNQRIAALYYPWFGEPGGGRDWLNREATGDRVPLPLGSDFMPQLGPYNVEEAAIAAQHFAWLREADIGMAVVSWWGPGSREDGTIPLLLEMAERYEMALTVVIERYDGRTSESVKDDVRYLREQYGAHPAFFTTTAASRWNAGDSEKALIFVARPEGNPSDWRRSMDSLHIRPFDAIMIANQIEAEWIEEGHFDGLYNNPNLEIQIGAAFGWAPCLPENTWFVPAIIPGFSQTYRPNAGRYARLSGYGYERQWQAVLEVPSEPAIVLINSFNNWLEGTQIEPISETSAGTSGYGNLAPTGYLALTSQWAAEFQSQPYAAQVSRLRLRVTTTSDWAELALIRGATMTCARLASLDSETGSVDFRSGDEGYQFPGFQIDHLSPDIAERLPGTFAVDLVLILPEAQPGVVEFRFEQGCLGESQIEFIDLTTSDTVEWASGADPERCGSGIFFTLTTGGELAISP